MGKIIFGLILWIVGLACGVLMAKTYGRDLDLNDYEEGYADGYKHGKHEVMDTFDDLCKRCDLRGGANG